MARGILDLYKIPCGFLYISDINYISRLESTLLSSCEMPALVLSYYKDTEFILIHQINIYINIVDIYKNRCIILYILILIYRVI